MDQKSENLTSILDNYHNLLNNTGIKDQIINAYRFETPATMFILPDTKDEKIEQFVRDLGEFFYAGAIPFKDRSSRSTRSKLILLSRFKNLFETSFHYYSYKWDSKLDNLADLSHVLSGRTLQDLSEYCSQERVGILEEIIDDYHHIYSDGGTKDQVVRAFIGAKPVTTIELYNQDFKIVAELSELLEDYFLVGQVSFEPKPHKSLFSGEIIVSRFRNPFDIMMRYITKGFGLSEWFADLSGFFILGKDAKEVAWYCCQKKQVKGYNLVK